MVISSDMMICEDYNDDREESYCDSKVTVTEYCEYCGAEIGEKDNVCPGCGAPRTEIRTTIFRMNGQHSDKQKEKVSFSTIVLAFLFPPVVLLTRHTWKKYMPKNYKAAKITAYISFVTLLFYLGSIQ